MRREVIALMGAAALIALMAVGLCGEVTAQTVMPGETGVDLTDARGQSGLNGAAEMKKKESPPDEPTYRMIGATIEWKVTGKDLVADVTVTQYYGYVGENYQWTEPLEDAEVWLELTLMETGETWTYFGVTDRKGNVEFAHSDVISGTYCGLTTYSWTESYYTVE